MERRQIRDTNFHTATEVLSHKDFIENDIILYDNMGKAPIPSEPRRMTFILVALCTQGTAKYTVDTQEKEIQANDVIIISERHVVDNYSASNDLEGLCLMMSVNFFYETIRNVSDISSMFLFSRNHPVVSLSPHEADVFKNYFALLKQKTAEVDNHFRRNVAQALILAMFYDLNSVIYRVQTSTAQRQTRADSIFTRFIMLVEENYKQERRVSWYADCLCISPKYLSETVKQVSKRTPNNWIDSYVTLEMRLQLKNSSKSIKEIAHDLNFPNQSFFGKYFKENVGMSPSEYRRK